MPGDVVHFEINFDFGRKDSYFLRKKEVASQGKREFLNNLNTVRDQ